MNNVILIIDFGSQVTQLIARRLRELHIYCEIYAFQNVNAEILKNVQPKAIILSGSPESVSAQNAPKIDEAIFELQCPILGICYGQQLLSAHFGGEIAQGKSREFGKAMLNINDEHHILLQNLPAQSPVWMSHGDHITALPANFKVIATTEGAPFAAIADDENHYYGVQFHPEVVHSAYGSQILQNFAEKIAKCQADWTMEHYAEQAIQDVRAQIGKNKVICALSGGVDSSVAAILVHRAVGEQLTCIFVDHGLLRAGEGEQVVNLFREHYHIKLIYCDESERFLGALAGITDPEQKRKIIGKLFIDVFEEAAKKEGGAKFLVQGTLYPDVIESVAVHGPSHTIKSHHNVGGLPEKMALKLVEPLRALFKDEVRELGEKLGLPHEMMMRHPFPGPGLAIRIPGEVTEEKCSILREIDKIYLEEIQKAGLYDEIWQAFAVLLPVKSVGVMGDSRSYEYCAALRAVTSKDGMTADIYHFSPEFLSHIATKIVNRVSGVNRILYDITSKPPGTIEWE